MTLRDHVVRVARRAKAASRLLAQAATEQKNRALRAMAKRLHQQHSELERANATDMACARARNLSSAMIDRLTLTPKRIEEMRASLEAVAALPDPVGEVIKEWRRPNGLRIRKVRVPIGAIGIIYESRPNVTADCAGLCVKSGNAVVLRGGSEAMHSNAAIARILWAAMRETGLPPAAIGFIARSERAGVRILLGLTQSLDLIIPRGGQSLIDAVAQQSRIPVVKHDKGVCHVYVDDRADLDMAQEIVYNAKVQRPGTCNAMETLLVHAGIARAFLPRMAQRFRQAGVELRGDPAAKRLVPWAKRATERDWTTEYLDLILSVRVVKDEDAAIEHISRYGSQHSDAIVTDDALRAQRFLNAVDSACVYVNASTRFTDGYQFGLGAEIGISTNRLHARGPMALEELTTYKYQVYGSGQLRV